MWLSSAVEWWQESQLRVLVLSSAFLQLFLLSTAPWRILRIPSWLRLFIWLAYLGSDAAAIYALATLFNRHRTATAVSILELLWAPILLVHLGGPATISAYNMEDNELWTRHAMTLLSQVTVALYVFRESWPSGGDWLLLSAAVLLFTIGIIKFSMKPWALKRASINNLAPSRSSVVGTRKVFTFFDLLSYFWPLCSSDALRSELGRRKEPTSVKKIDAVVKDLVYNPKDISVQLYVREAKQALQGVKTEEESDEQPHPKIPNPETETEFAGFMRKEDLWFTYSRHQPLLLADRLVPYRHRLSSLRNFLQHPPQERVYAALDTILSSMFHLLYTKQKTYMTTLGVLTIYLTVPLSIAAIGLFARAPKHGYSQSDVTVTYILLSWIAATEVLQLYCLLYVRTCQMYCAFKSVNVVRVPQHSIMSFVVRRKTATRSMNKMLLAALIGLDDSVNRSSWYNGPTSTCRRIVHAVLQQVELGWKEYIHDASSFRRFNDRRGCWTVSRCQQQHVVDQPSSSSLAVIRSSLRVPFDRSVVLWHIATDLCSHHHDGAPSPSNEPKEDPAATARAISNYMAYLLILHPEMLMAGTTPDLFDIACEDLEVILKHDKEPPAPLHEKGLAQGIVRNAGSLLSWLFERNLISPVLWEASKLAEALMEMGSEERWSLIEGVWTEMLCYSASRCRGYLHAKSLGQGRELLTYVWLFLSQMGMDTYADRLQTPEAPEEEDEDVGVGDASTSQPQEAPPQLEEITLA